MDNIYNRAYGRNNMLLYLVGPIIGDLVIPNLRNAFIEDPDYENNKPNEENFYIYAEIGSDGRHKYNEDIKNIKKHKYFIDQYDEDDKFTVFIFRFPKKFRKDYKYIKGWKFGKISQEYKNKLNNMWGKDFF